MWIFTVDGFFSVLRHDRVPEFVIVRARVKADLERLLERVVWDGVAITETPTNDYHYRVLLRSDTWEDYLIAAARLISHAPVKSQVGTRHDRDTWLWQVWLAGADHQARGA